MKLEEAKSGQRVRLLPGSQDAEMIQLPTGSVGTVLSTGALVGVQWDNFEGGWTYNEKPGGWSVEAEHLELLEETRVCQTPEFRVVAGPGGWTIVCKCGTLTRKRRNRIIREVAEIMKMPVNRVRWEFTIVRVEDTK